MREDRWHPWTTLVLEAWHAVYDAVIFRGGDAAEAREAAEKVLVSHMDGGPYSWHMKALAAGHEQAIDDLLTDPQPFYGYPIWGENPYELERA